MSLQSQSEDFEAACLVSKTSLAFGHRTISKITTRWDGKFGRYVSSRAYQAAKGM